MLYVAVVVYNKKINEIASVENLRRLLAHHSENIKIIVVDNSDKAPFNELDDEEKMFISQNGVVYIKSDNNQGLSKAYNKAVKYALHEKKNPDSSFVLFVDDDTVIPYAYFRRIYLESKSARRQSDGVNVITGFVESDGRPMSPVWGFRFRFSSKDYIVKPGIYNNIACISSGMAVRLSALKRIKGFDERLFLDMIDYTMLYNLGRRNLCKVLVVDEKLVQDFSGRSNQSRDAVEKRFEIYKKDFNTFCNITRRGKLYAKLHLFKRRIAIEYKVRRNQ